LLALGYLDLLNHLGSFIALVYWKENTHEDRCTVREAIEVNDDFNVMLERIDQLGGPF